MFSIQSHVRRLAMGQVASPPAAPAQPRDPCPAEPAADAPHGTPEALARCGAASALSVGTCFGSTFALSQHLRAKGGPLPKVASAWLVLGGAALTAYAEPLARQWTGARPTPWARPSLGCDAVTPAVLLGANLLYLYSSLPKYPGGSLRSWGANLLLSTAGCGVAGALTEALARSDTRDRQDAAAPSSSLRQRAAGRALSLVPMAMVQQIPAAWLLHGRPLPRALAPVPIVVGTGGWAFRRVLAPATDNEPIHAPKAADAPCRVAPDVLA